MNACMQKESEENGPELSAIFCCNEIHMLIHILPYRAITIFNRERERAIITATLYYSCQPTSHLFPNTYTHIANSNLNLCQTVTSVKRCNKDRKKRLPPFLLHGKFWHVSKKQTAIEFYFYFYNSHSHPLFPLLFGSYGNIHSLVRTHFTAAARRMSV